MEKLVEFWWLRRRDEIRKYKAATCLADRIKARTWALRYARFARNEGEA